MRIVLLGAPGSGKGTQGKLLSAKHNIPQISTGDLLRAAVSAGTWLGKQAKAAMDAGQLVSDEIVLGIIGERLAEPDAVRGFILDGFPRNIPQADALDQLLERLNAPLQAVLLINVEAEVLIERLTGRRTCESCGQMYNIYTSPSRLDDRCDKCGGNLRHRADDNEETITNRLRVYDQQTAPLISYFEEQGKLRTVHGEGDIDGIFVAIEDTLRDLPVAAAESESKEERPTLEDLAKKVMAAAARATPSKRKPKSKPKPVAKAEPAPAAAKSPVAKTAPAKKAATKQAVKKKTTKKKPAVKQTVAKKAVSQKKVGAKKAATKKKVTAKKAAAKRAIKKKVTAKKGVAKKTTANRAARKPVSKKKVTTKKEKTGGQAARRQEEIDEKGRHQEIGE